jgi:protein-S-isoprenylcysteine O-methyltransferase Ste14
MRLESLELKVPPLALTAGAAALIVGVEYVSEGTSVVAPLLIWVVGGAVALSGLAIAYRGVSVFRRIRTTVDPMHPERSARLVTAGVYRWTRNPMYLGFVLFLLGLAVAFQSLIGFALTAFTAVFLQRFQIEPEEQALSRRFGAAFDAYCGRVRRWV